MNKVSNVESLHMKQIEYATSNNRFYIIHWIQTWNGFNSLTSNTIYFDLSSEEFRDEFISVVLPNIYQYDLTNEQNRIIQQLNYNEFYLSTANGFKYLRNKSKVSISDCSTTNAAIPENDNASLVVLSNENFNKVQLNATLNDANISAITVASVAVSTMPELILRKLLKPEEICRRLREKKKCKLDYSKKVETLKKYDYFNRLFHKFLQNKYKPTGNAGERVVESDQTNKEP